MEQIHAVPTVEGWRRLMLQPQQFPNVGSKRLQAKLASAWTDAVTRAFDVEVTIAALRRNAAQSFSAEDLAWSKRFNESDLGRRVLAAEAASLEKTVSRQPDMAAEMTELAAMQKALDANPLRARALKRLYAAGGGEVSSVDMILAMQLGTAYGVLVAAPKGQPRPEPNEMLALVEQGRPALRKMIAATMLPVFARVYERLPTRDIEAYAAALESPGGRRVTAEITRLMGRTVRDAAISVGEEFARQMQSEAL